MIEIRLHTTIAADLRACFDAARSIDLHVESVHRTRERAIAGKTSGLAELGDWITWEARHFGIRFQMTNEITRCEPPVFFQDRMRTGPFAFFEHDHAFRQLDVGVEMADALRFAAPLGILGRVAERVALEGHLRRFLTTRNAFLKQRLEQGALGSKG